MVFKYKEKQGHDYYTIWREGGNRLREHMEGVFGVAKFYFLTGLQGCLLYNSLSFTFVFCGFILG